MKINNYIPSYQAFKESFYGGLGDDNFNDDAFEVQDKEADSILAGTKAYNPASASASTEQKDTKFNELVNMLIKKSDKLTSKSAYFKVLDCCTLHFIETEKDDDGIETENKIEVYFDEEKGKFFVGADEYSTAKEVIDYLL